MRHLIKKEVLTHHCFPFLSQVEIDAEDYKRDAERTPAMIASQRFDPKWVPMPTLGKQLEEIGAFDLSKAVPK